MAFTAPIITVIKRLGSFQVKNNQGTPVTNFSIDFIRSQGERDDFKDKTKKIQYDNFKLVLFKQNLDYKTGDVKHKILTGANGPYDGGRDESYYDLPLDLIISAFQSFGLDANAFRMDLEGLQADVLSGVESGEDNSDVF